MSALEAGVSFDLTFPYPITPPSQHDFLMHPSYAFDAPPFLDLPSAYHDARSSSKPSSVYSAVSAADSAPDSVSTGFSTPPPRPSPPVRHHGPVLLPRIRPQDQHIDACEPLRAAPAPARKSRSSRCRNGALSAARTASRTAAEPIPSGHTGSYAATTAATGTAYAHLASLSGTDPVMDEHSLPAANPAPLLSSSVDFSNFTCRDGRNTGIMTTEPGVMTGPRPASTCFAGLDADALGGGYGYPPYRHSSLASSSSSTHSMMTTPPPDLPLPSFLTRAQSPVSLAGSPEPVSMSAPPAPCTTLIHYLTMPNPAASLVRTISLPTRDSSIRHFWWDVRNVRPWRSFNAQSILALPGASALLTTPVPASFLPRRGMPSRHPETEASLHGIYASYYLPKLNAALSLSSGQPLQLSVPAKSSSSHSIKDLVFVANPAAESSTATAPALFGGKPLARVVGLVRSFDRFNTGMRVEGNVKRVEYLRGLAALQHAMREHCCRYGFILTEIELVLVRSGTEPVPFFGHLEVTSVQLSDTAARSDDAAAAAAAAAIAPTTTTTSSPPLTACLALWGLCQLAGDDTPAGHAPWRAEIGAPAEGTRRKAKPRDAWMPQPQLAEKREAKRTRGWIWPEDAVGRKELGKRGVKYGGI
ncbi:hypothetical protein E4U41_000568 [Claviceps citrina]|nr:hypothetical protein E4U41_000568 [Claviceps citrina]